MDRYLRTKEVCELTGVSRFTIARMVKAGRFPQPRKLNNRAVGWLRSKVMRWMKKQGK